MDAAPAKRTSPQPTAGQCTRQNNEAPRRSPSSGHNVCISSKVTASISMRARRSATRRCTGNTSASHRNYRRQDALAHKQDTIQAGRTLIATSIFRFKLVVVNATHIMMGLNYAGNQKDRTKRGGCRSIRDQRWFQKMGHSMLFSWRKIRKAASVIHIHEKSTAVDKTREG